ncbi:MAG: N-acetylmuramoyl-L-alanine amidase [Clostridia bacterium]|nr:N-acetylmuramoyl-L-alanine amidase [Clostridia bacterium]
MVKIMLDPGHAGRYYNASPAVSGYFESEMTWSLAQKLKLSLERRGFYVGLTRENIDDDPPLVERGRRSAGYDLFLSLHSNASNNEAATSPWMICFSDDVNTDSDDISREVGRLIGDTVSRIMGVTESVIYTKMTDFDRDGNGLLDDEYYGVLFGAKSVGVPGVIVEHSFHTNREATLWLMSEENLEKLAEAEAEVLLEYFGVGGEKDMTESERADLSKLKRNVDRLIEENKSYDRIEDCPEWARDTVLKLTNKKYLMGDGTKLSLREDMLRIFVILDRIGLV